MQMKALQKLIIKSSIILLFFGCAPLKPPLPKICIYRTLMEIAYYQDKYPDSKINVIVGYPSFVAENPDDVHVEPIIISKDGNITNFGFDDNWNWFENGDPWKLFNFMEPFEIFTAEQFMVVVADFKFATNLSLLKFYRSFDEGWNNKKLHSK